MKSCAVFRNRSGQTFADSVQPYQFVNARKCATGILVSAVEMFKVSSLLPVGCFFFQKPVDTEQSTLYMFCFDTLQTRLDSEMKIFKVRGHFSNFLLSD